MLEARVCHTSESERDREEGELEEVSTEAPRVRCLRTTSGSGRKDERWGECIDVSLPRPERRSDARRSFQKARKTRLMMLREEASGRYEYTKNSKGQEM
jgi:hypothetical protein